MKFLFVCLGLFSIGCANNGGDNRDSPEMAAETADTTGTVVAAIYPEYQILTCLKSTNRNTVHVALWTLKSNNIETPSEIDFDSHYKDIATHLESLADRLAKLDKSRLDELDESLAHHWQIYSPIWGPPCDTWD